MKSGDANFGTLGAVSGAATHQHSASQMRAVANVTFDRIFVRQSGIAGGAAMPAFTQQGSPLTITPQTGSSAVGIELTGITDAGSTIQPSITLNPLIKT